jgi:hypothetical protein
MSVPKPNSEFKNIFDYMRYQLDDTEYLVFVKYTKQDGRGYFVLQDTEAAQKATGYSVRKLQELVRYIEGLARIWELILLDRE